MTPEGKVKKWLKDRMLQEYPDCYFYSPPGGAFGKAGTPDHLYLCEGVFVAIEVKSDKGKPTKLQLATLNKIVKAKGVAAIITGKDEARLKLILSTIRLEIKLRAKP